MEADNCYSPFFPDHTFIADFTASSSRDGETTMPDAFLDSKHEIVDDWRHVDTVSFFQLSNQNVF